MLIRKIAAVGGVEVNGNQLTVYHRTKSGEIGRNICNIGFIIGHGAAYGPGIYTTYTIDSSLKNANLTTYGSELLKGEMNIANFLIFDYDLAKHVYGVNYRLIDQVKMLGYGNLLLNNRSYIENDSERLDSIEWSSDMAAAWSHRYNLAQIGVPGLIFTGRRDGNVALAFRETLVVPKAHAYVDGKTYKNPDWKECPARSNEELIKMQTDDQKSKLYTAQRSSLIKAIEVGNSINKSDYPNIPDGIFDQVVIDFIYADSSRKKIVDKETLARLGDAIDSELFIRKLKGAPTVHWSEWETMPEETKAKIPNSIIADVWENYLIKNPGHWLQIPDSAKPMISKETEAQYWKKNVGKNAANWRYIPEDIALYMEDNLGVIRGSNIPLPPEKAEERLSETEIFDIHPSAMKWIQEEISKMNQKAAKLGLPPITVSVISDDIKNQIQKVKIIGNVPVLKGWKLVAKINISVNEDGEEENRVVFPLRDEPAPESLDLENTNLRCDHCNENRRRHETFLLQNEKDQSYHMIGSSCMEAFIGMVGGKDPASIADYAQTFRQMVTKFKESDKYRDKKESVIVKLFKKDGVPSEFFLGKVLSLRKRFKEVGVEEQKDTWNYELHKDSIALPTYPPPAQPQAPTIKSDFYSQYRYPRHLIEVKNIYEAAWEMCIDSGKNSYWGSKLTGSDITKINNSIKWAKEAIPDLPAGADPRRVDPLCQTKENIKNGFVFQKRKRSNNNKAIIGQILSAYDKYVEEGRDFSKLLGEIGTHIKFDGVIRSKKSIFTSIAQQGSANVSSDYCILEDSNGNIVVWYGEHVGSNSGVGNRIIISGDIEGYVLVDGQSATSLKNVSEIPLEEYKKEESIQEEKTREFRDLHKNDTKAASSTYVARKYYRDGDVVEDTFSVRYDDGQGVKTQFFKQYNKFVVYDTGGNIFTIWPGDVKDMSGDKKDSTMKLRGTVKVIEKPSSGGRYINKYYNLIDVVRLDAPMTTTTTTTKQSVPSQSTGQPLVQPPRKLPYATGDVVEDDFTISNIRLWKGNVYIWSLIDMQGRRLTSFSDKKLGIAGSTVRLKGVVKLNPPYTNLNNVSVVPQSQAKTNTVTPPSSSPSIPVNLAQPPTSNMDPVDSASSWYSIYKISSTLKLKTKAKNGNNWYHSIK